jgi:hypothetical protein
VYDTPAKTQVTQSVILEGTVSADDVSAELVRRYDEIVNRSGFRYRKHPNSVGIHVYGSREQAESEFALWVAMLLKPAAASTYEISIREEQLAALSSDETQHGLSEATRKAIYAAWMDADRRAEREASATIPDMDMEQAELVELLSNKYRDVIRTKYKLTESQASEIAQEGLIKGWP